MASTLEFDSVSTGRTLEFDQPVAAPKQRTQDDFLREAAQEMPWGKRQIASAGLQLMKGYQGIKSLIPGVTADKNVIQAADIAGQEAPIGAMVGEVVKYAPVALAGTATLPVAAASAVLGAAYDPTGHRVSSAALEGTFGAGGAILGRTLPQAIGRGQSLYNRVRERLGGPTAETFYGATDRASDVAKRLIGEGNEVAASRVLGEAGDVRSVQALADLPNAEGVAVLDKLVRSGKGIRASSDPIEAANFYAEQAARQGAGRNEVMERMAKGSTAEETAIARDLFSKMSANELVPIRDSILNKIKQTGLTLDEILPQLSQKEAAYVSALQQQGRMATEAGQQGVLKQGAKVPRGQTVPNAADLPTGAYPRDPMIATQKGDELLPFANRGTQGEYAARVGEYSGAANELGDIASGLRTEADALRKQISELPSAFTAAPVRNAVERMAQGINGTKRTVASRIAEELRIAGDDPVKIAEVRRLGVNQIIGDLVDGGKLSQKDAAAALTDVKKLIDKQLGSEFVTRYMEPYAKKLDYRASLELADKLRDLQKNNQKEFLQVMQGNNPELVAKYGDWPTIKQALGEKRFGRASGIAKEVQRDLDIERMAKSKEHGAAVKELLENKSITRHFPNLLNRYVVLTNEAIKRGEMEVNKGMYRELEHAIRSPSKMKELIDRLPPEERSQIINYAMKLGKSGGIAGAVSGEQVRK